MIRATSPLDGESVWLEIFAPGVSKGSAAAWLAARLGVVPAAALGLGNDYNDLELLEWTGHSYVVADAPAALRARYAQTRANGNGPLSAALAETGAAAAAPA